MSPLPDKLYSPGQVIYCVILHWKNSLKKKQKQGKKLIPDAKKDANKSRKKGCSECWIIYPNNVHVQLIISKLF